MSDMSYPSGSSVMLSGCYTEADLTTLQFCGFKPDAGGKITSAATSGLCGILQDANVKGSTGVKREAALLIAGGGKMKVNGQSVNIAVFDTLVLTTGGVGIKGVADKDVCIAIALAPATADGVVIPIWKPGPGFYVRA